MSDESHRASRLRARIRRIARRHDLALSDQEVERVVERNLSAPPSLSNLRASVALLRHAWEGSVIALDNHDALDRLPREIAAAVSDDWDDVNHYLTEVDAALAELERRERGEGE